MAATTTAQARPQRVFLKGYPADSRRFDWLFVFLGFLFVCGLMVDGWAHFHGEVDGSFFTPWHFLFYSAFGIVGLFLAFHQFRNMRKGHAFKKALPQGYFLSAVGANLFAVGGIGDMIWHTLFGIEGDSEALLSPSHLMLVIGMGLVVTGPLRAAWQRSTQSRSWLAMGPAVIGATLFLTLAAFFTTYAHPFINPAAVQAPSEEAAALPTSDLYLMNADGTEQTRLTNDPDHSVLAASWSPDGSQVVVTRTTGEEREADLYLMNADASDLVQLTDMPGLELAPAWSPDGKSIAFMNERGQGGGDIYTINIDGSDLVQITDTPGGEFSPTWSVDGTQITYSQQTPDGYSIIVANADGSDPSVFADGFSFALAWSPDGSQMAYTANVDDNFDIYVVSEQGAEPTRLTTHPEFDGFPSWSPDGTQIVFQSWRDGHSEVYVITPDGESEDSPAVNLTRNAALNNDNARFSPDGEHILYTAGALESADGEFSSQDAGVAAILLQSAFIAGVVLLLVQRWALPFGAITFVLTVSTLAMALLSDMFMLLPAALIAGLIADVLIWRLKPSENRRALPVVAFVVPALLIALYMLTLQLAIGIGWSIHVWTGSIFLSGLVGLLLSSLVTASSAPSQPPPAEA